MQALIISSIAIGLFARFAGAGIIFSDNFDDGPVGAFPTNWTIMNNAVPSNGTFAVAKALDAPSPPNALQIANPLNGGYEIGRFFPDLTLTTGATVVLSFSLNVTQIPLNTISADAGFTICLGQGSGGGFSWNFPGFSLRAVSEADNPMAWVIREASHGRNVASSLATRAFHPLRIEIQPSATNAGTGTITMLLHEREVAAFDYDSGSNTVMNGIRIDPQVGLAKPFPCEFWLDDVSLESKP